MSVILEEPPAKGIETALANLDGWPIEDEDQYDTVEVLWGPVGVYGLPQDLGVLTSLSELVLAGWHYQIGVSGAPYLCLTDVTPDARFRCLSGGGYVEFVVGQIADAVAEEAGNEKPTFVRHVTLPHIGIDAIWVGGEDSDSFSVLNLVADGKCPVTKMDAEAFIAKVASETEFRRRSYEEARRRFPEATGIGG